MFIIKYKGMFNIPIEKEFKSRDEAETWCRSIGKPELIFKIEEIPCLS